MESKKLFMLTNVRHHVVKFVGCLVIFLKVKFRAKTTKPCI